MRNKDLAIQCRVHYKAWRQHNSKTRKGFFPVFNDFLPYLKELSGGATQLYLYLGIHSGNFTGESFHDLDRMAEFFKVNERTVRNWLKELEEKKLITRMQLRMNGISHTFLAPYPQSTAPEDLLSDTMKDEVKEEGG